MTEATREPALEAARRDMAARRGSKWAFETLDPARSAVVGLDVTGFGMAQIPKLRTVLPRIDWLARTMRAAGGLVVWNQLDPEALDGRAGEILGWRETRSLRRALAEDGGDAPAEELTVSATDRRIARRAYTAFAPMLCHMPYILKDMRIDTVILVGAGTEVSIDASARDACAAGFRVVVAADACAAYDDAVQDAALATLHRRFADVRPTKEVVALLRRHAGQPTEDDAEDAAAGGAA